MTQLSIDLAKEHYHFALPCYDGSITTETALGLLETCAQLTQKKVSHSFSIIRSGSLIDQSRNELVARFLDREDATVLVFIDSDISFDWPAMSRLLAWATMYPLISGAYNSKRDSPHFIVNPADTKLNEHALLPIHSLGIGFTAIQRKVFGAIDAPIFYHSHLGKDIPAYFQMGVVDGKYIGEDVWFFNQAEAAGFQPMLDPFIKLGHVGIKEYNTPFEMALSKIVGDEST